MINGVNAAETSPGKYDTALLAAQVLHYFFVSKLHSSRAYQSRFISCFEGKEDKGKKHNNFI